MCDHTSDLGGREAAMAVIERNGNGCPTVWCDPCIAPLVAALNAAGLRTIASCCGHGRNDSSVALADGRWVTVTAGPPVAYEHRPMAQGEASDAAVSAALESYWGYPDGYSRGQFEKMRAALRAAWGVR